MTLPGGHTWIFLLLYIGCRYSARAAAALWGYLEISRHNRWRTAYSLVSNVNYKIQLSLTAISESLLSNTWAGRLLGLLLEAKGEKLSVITLLPRWVTAAFSGSLAVDSVWLSPHISWGPTHAVLVSFLFLLVPLLPADCFSFRLSIVVELITHKLLLIQNYVSN